MGDGSQERKDLPVSGDVSDRKRLVAITEGNIAHKHVYLFREYDSFVKTDPLFY